jgi:hypothetical protein
VGLKSNTVLISQNTKKYEINQLLSEKNDALNNSPFFCAHWNFESAAVILTNCGLGLAG